MNLALIVSAARGLFVDDGYVATTIERIAERAGVSKPTAFASVGNKRALLKAARDLAMAGDDEPVPIAARSWFQEALAEPDPRQSVRLHARNVTRMHRQAG
jgi:AcrR family transcriptional regulator